MLSASQQPISQRTPNNNLRVKDKSCQTYQLIQVPPANGQAALVLIHAPTEVLHIHLAWRTAVLRVVHSRAGAVGLLGFGGCGRRAAEHAADGMTDGGADGDATIDDDSHVSVL